MTTSGTDIQIDIQINRDTHIQTDKQTHRRTDEQERQRQTDRDGQTDSQTYTQIDTPTGIDCVPYAFQIMFKISHYNIIFGTEKLFAAKDTLPQIIHF